ncbi:MAG: protein-methionine-sulfoxide reductase catalytic subunit MsrP [Ectothiorhodospiraceae bacterium]|nr:protein-methionine-sulfoxide reductase catalytic subunit MsrP [Ectothiorhodospiraceae bacterium]
MLIKRPEDIRPSEITDEAVFRSRRTFLRTAAVAGVATAGLGLAATRGVRALATHPDVAAGEKIPNVVESAYKVDEALTPFESVTTYNNFYEFGTDKGDPVARSGKFEPRPWSVKVSGECEKPGEVDLDALLAPHQLEERIYRLRCVEAWSMVVPWVAVPLGPLLARFAPTSKAKYVAFKTVYRPDQMPGQRSGFIDWPYVEGLRIDEATHPLTVLAVGVYGQVLPNQNGAPLRLVVPWKYGFKSIKSIVSIEFTEKEPPTTWNIQGPSEYGFYANVNPEVDHPRWSQSRERRIGELFRRETLMFNGYADEVASLYAGMDLAKHY